MPSPDKFIVACPGCQAKFKVPAALAGRTTDCPRCKHPIEIPASLGDEAAGTAAGPPPALPPVEESRPGPIARRPAIDDDDDRDDDRGRRRRRDRDDDRYDDDDDDDRPRRRRNRLEPHRGSTVLVLGILSFFIAGIILGPIAWVMGNEDLRKMKDGRMDRDGESNTQVGRVMGMISTFVHIAAIVFCCGGFLLIAALGGAKGR